jgi:hypothetical protein
MRLLQDADLLTWEVFASAARPRSGDTAAVLFHCLSDPSRRPRIALEEGDQATAERLVAGAGDEELLRLLGNSREIE